MKTIQPVNVWSDGLQQEATVLSAQATNDNLIDSAQFYYQLGKQNNPEISTKDIQYLVNGYLLMTGEAYQNWETNGYAYDWVASQLNLVITGEYVPPAPPEPTPEPQPEILPETPSETQTEA